MAKESFALKIIAPDRIFYEGDVTFLEMNTTEGKIGVYPAHIPMTVIAVPGILTIHETGGGVKKADLQSGFAEILQKQITILAERIRWSEDSQAAE